MNESIVIENATNISVLAGLFTQGSSKYADTSYKKVRTYANFGDKKAKLDQGRVFVNGKLQKFRHRNESILPCSKLIWDPANCIVHNQMTGISHPIYKDTVLKFGDVQIGENVIMTKDGEIFLDGLDGKKYIFVKEGADAIRRLVLYKGPVDLTSLLKSTKLNVYVSESKGAEEHVSPSVYAPTGIKINNNPFTKNDISVGNFGPFRLAYRIGSYGDRIWIITDRVHRDRVITFELSQEELRGLKLYYFYRGEWLTKDLDASEKDKVSLIHDNILGQVESGELTYDSIRNFDDQFYQIDKVGSVAKSSHDLIRATINHIMEYEKKFSRFTR